MYNRSLRDDSKKTSRGDEIISDIGNNYINITYLRKRGKPTEVKINRYINREIFLVGIVIWACEGTRRRIHELEVSNSSVNITKMYMSLLRELGIEKHARFRVQALKDDIKSCEKFWEECLGIKKSENPLHI